MLTGINIIIFHPLLFKTLTHLCDLRPCSKLNLHTSSHLLAINYTGSLIGSKLWGKALDRPMTFNQVFTQILQKSMWDIYKTLHREKAQQIHKSAHRLRLQTIYNPKVSKKIRLFTFHNYFYHLLFLQLAILNVMQRIWRNLNNFHCTAKQRE